MKPYLFFDLDGTLLRMDRQTFTKAYMNHLFEYLKEEIQDKNLFLKTCKEGLDYVRKNDGTMTNKERFFSYFFSILDCNKEKVISLFEEYHQTKFDELEYTCKRNPDAIETIYRLKKEGYHMSLATNPCFPRSALAKRIEWAGFQIDDFEYFPSYDEISYAKPSLDFYLEMLKRTRIEASQCIMIGNDFEEDMIARNLPMNVFLLTYDLIHRGKEDISSIHQGTYQDLYHHLAKIQ